MSERERDQLYAFTHLDKTAGRTVRAILRRSFGSSHCEIRTPYARRSGDRHDRSVHVTASDLRRVRRIYRHLSGIAGHNVKPYSTGNACRSVSSRFSATRSRGTCPLQNRALTYDRADFDVGRAGTHA
jgi:hypothetical protein